MKWITHQSGAILGALVMGMPWPGVAAAGAGAIFPDVIDLKVSSLGGSRAGRQKIFNRIHRGPSHWFGWWLMLLLLFPVWPLPALVRDAAAGFLLGALSHVAFDMLTPQGIPLLPFSRRGKLALPVCTTGKPGEYLFLLLLWLAGGVWFGEELAPALKAAMRYF